LKIEYQENKRKVEELDHAVKYERMLAKYEWNMQNIWNTMKRPNL
jgi:hypothetical protein